MPAPTPVHDLPPSWVPGAAGSPYDVDNLPYAVGSIEGAPVQVLTRIGDQVVGLADLAAATGIEPAIFRRHSLNALMAEGPAAWATTRSWLQLLLTAPAMSDTVRTAPIEAVELSLPFEVADYVDYYASEQHASNIGRILRPQQEPLLPNWKHLPVAYHGRAGSVIVSGTDVHRPCGQLKAPDAVAPEYGPCRRLDIEAELGFVVGHGIAFGNRVGTADFETCVFGVAGVNDWSARDVQAWEYQPLGPNLAKSFATSISAWVTPLAALEPARIELPKQDPPVVSYLEQQPLTSYDIDVEVELNGEVVSRPPFRSMYWSPAQMLAHLCVNGASLRTGDLYASGTISGREKEQYGSFMELSWGGREPFDAGGEQHTFLRDGDEVALRYSAPGVFDRIGLGEVRGRILPAV